MWGSGQGMPPACVPFGDHSNSTKEGDAHPPIPPSAWAGSWGGGTGPAPATAGFQPCPAPGSSWEGSGPTVASPALLVRLNLPPSLRQGASKGALRPLRLPGQVGAGWRSKALPFSQAQAPASPRHGPSATAGTVKSRLPLAGAPGLELWLCGRGSAGPGGTGTARPCGGAGAVLGERGTGCLLRSGHCSWCRRGFSACGAGRRQVLAARWCALELGAEPRGRGLSVELAGPSFSGCLTT